MQLDLNFGEESCNENEAFIESLRQLQILGHLRIQSDVLIVAAVVTITMMNHWTCFQCFQPLSRFILFSRAKVVPVMFTQKGNRKKQEEGLPSMKTFINEDITSIAKVLEDECAGVGIDLTYLSKSINRTDVRA